MDWVAYRQMLRNCLGKYRYIVIAVLAGILLMSLPPREEEQPAPAAAETAAEDSLEESLAAILSKLSGAGRVEVLLTQQEGACTLYQTDEVLGERDSRRDTVLVTQEDRSENGLVRQIMPPVYRGAVIVCQGAGDPAVKLSIVEAVKSVTGLSADRITVLKMK